MKMEKIKVIERAKGMGKEGAIELLKNHQGLQETKIKRLERELDRTIAVHDAIYNEIGRREKEAET